MLSRIQRTHENFVVVAVCLLRVDERATCMKRLDRVEIPSTPDIPVFSDDARRYLGMVIGFYERSVLVLLDEPVMIDDHPERIVRVPTLLPAPVGMRHVEGRGWIEIDLRHLCTTSACMNPPT